MSEDTENKPQAPEAQPFHQGTANLKPFQPGQSGNPAGKKKGTLNRKTLFTKALEMAAAAKANEEQRRTLGEEHAPETIADQIVARLVIDALAGDKTAISMLLDGSMDKVAEKSEVTGNFFTLLDRARTKQGDELSLGDKSCLTPNGDLKPSS